MSWHAWLPRFTSAIHYACTPPLRPKGYLAATLRAYRKREPLQWASPQDVWLRQRAMINELLAHTVQNVPYYRSLHRAGSMPDRIERAEDMMAIPVLTKDTVRLRGEELVAENFPRSLMYRNATGGSTGAPVQFWSDEESNILTSSGQQWSDSLTGLDVRSPVALLWGVPLVDTSIRHRVAEGFYRALANQLLINCFRMGERELSRAHRLLTAFAPEALVGYANALAELAAFLRQKGLEPNYPSKAVISAAETLDDVSRKLIEQTFRVPVFNRYGSREFGLIAMECNRHVGLHIDCERIYLDMLDDPHSPGMRRHPRHQSLPVQHALYPLRYRRPGPRVSPPVSLRARIPGHRERRRARNGDSPDARRPLSFRGLLPAPLQGLRRQGLPHRAGGRLRA